MRKKILDRFLELRSLSSSNSSVSVNEYMCHQLIINKPLFHMQSLSMKIRLVLIKLIT